MVASQETLQDLAAERQLQPATLERVIRLIEIPDAFGADTLIGPWIALKGGTALNVFHSDLGRLSVDVDVNYVGAVEKKQMDADRPGMEDRIARLMESKGYAACREPSEPAGGHPAPQLGVLPVGPNPGVSVEEFAGRWSWAGKPLMATADDRVGGYQNGPSNGQETRIRSKPPRALLRLATVGLCLASASASAYVIDVRGIQSPGVSIPRLGSGGLPGQRAVGKLGQHVLRQADPQHLRGDVLG